MAFLAIIRDTVRHSLAQAVALLMLGLAVLIIVLAGLTWQVSEEYGFVKLVFFGIEKNAEYYASLEEAVPVIRTFYSLMWTVIGSLMFIFAAAFLTTRKLLPGISELYVSLPVSRASILMARATGIYIVYFVPLLLAVSGVWLVTAIKTGVYGPGFIYILLFHGLYGLAITGLAVALGTVGGNPALPILLLTMVTVNVAFVFPFLKKDELLKEPPVATALSDNGEREDVKDARNAEEPPMLLRFAGVSKQYLMPPLGDLTACATALQYPHGRILRWRPVYVALGQAAFGFALALLWFSKKDY